MPQIDSERKYATAVEVTAYLEDSPIALRYLAAPGAGRLGGQKRPRWVPIVNRKSMRYTIGDAPKVDMHLADRNLPSRAFPLVLWRPSGFHLLCPADVQGDIAWGDQRSSLRALCSAPMRAGDTPTTVHSIPIPLAATATVHFGKLWFRIQAVTPQLPVAAPWLGRFRWAEQRSTVLSALAHGLILLVMFAVPPDARGFSMGEPIDTDRPLVRALITPTADSAQATAQALVGDASEVNPGVRHRGSEGEMGDPTKPKQRRRHTVNGPATNPDPRLPREHARERADTLGVVGILGGISGGPIASLLSPGSAIGSEAEDHLGKLVAPDPGDGGGLGGLGMTGPGEGGGGTGDGIIGVGDDTGIRGRIRGRPDGVIKGDRLATLPDRDPGGPKFIPRQPTVRGALDKAIIRRVIHAHRNQIKHCYEKALMGDDDLAGRLVVRFAIQPTGTVASVVIAESNIDSSELSRCVTDVMQRMSFPSPENGGLVIVSYPFRFAQAGK